MPIIFKMYARNSPSSIQNVVKSFHIHTVIPRLNMFITVAFENVWLFLKWNGTEQQK